ncbi:hydrogenase nickel incorporation protein HypA/HybF [Alteromonadaceae bacterium 2753L.S.0a.02]|nr:hydrogenase nickel incorporation protein HypA/HybF [Alteromonadaceae bacterium 2753L.S.0a.02]
MHEMSLCEGVLQVLEDTAAQQQFQRVIRVWLEIGQLAAVEKNAMSFCFDVVTRNTLAEGAQLEIIEVKAEAWCLQCASVVTITQRYDACPKCGSYQLQINGGDELKIRELEVA